MIWGKTYSEILTFGGLHWLLGFAVGLGVYFLTLTIILHIKGLKWGWKVDRYILYWLCALSFSVSIVVHVLEDWLIGAF